ncbi:MAG TPA: fumarylacetoacetate hydrolase family protein [Candidatus Acidoferrum sp.]|nr:fumarylacetoacetate hydrolase family protein [Candidatus Acidoferrum sp.]
MRFCRFLPLDQSAAPSPAPAYGVIEGDTVREITASPWSSWQRASHTFPLSSVRLLTPVDPRKIVCVGRNYAAHAAELGNELPKEPLIFLKPSSSVVGPDEPIVLTKYSQRVEHEGELALVIGRRCSHLDDHEDPLSYLAGYSCLNDVTARDLQKADVQFTRAKGFDTFCPVGPWIESQLDPSDLAIETHVNSASRQSARTSLMAYSPAFLVRWISRMMTLDPGDVIATGTPAGVGPLVAGDSVEVRIAGIGVLRNPVHAPRA